MDPLIYAIMVQDTPPIVLSRIMAPDGAANMFAGGR